MSVRTLSETQSSACFVPSSASSALSMRSTTRADQSRPASPPQSSHAMKPADGSDGSSQPGRLSTACRAKYDAMRRTVSGDKTSRFLSCVALATPTSVPPRLNSPRSRRPRSASDAISFVGVKSISPYRSGASVVVALRSAKMTLSVCGAGAGRSSAAAAGASADGAGGTATSSNGPIGVNGTPPTIGASASSRSSGSRPRASRASLMVMTPDATRPWCSCKSRARFAGTGSS